MIDRMKKISDRIYKGNSVSEEKKNKKSVTTRNLLKKMRNLNEQEEGVGENKKTIYDQSREERNFRNNVDDLNVTVEFYDLKVYDNLVMWGGKIDGVLEFVYKVTPYEDLSGISYNYLEDFNAQNEDNEEVIERIENYYDQFYKYWRDNVFQA